ncbi:MAG: hypothetical protein IJ401_02940 [Oscillospiraceae bacterium]|nr:hypothetical protein [Oscillospiraceae bacterium]
MAYKGDTLKEVLYVFIGGNLSEERLSPVPPSKDFNTKICQIGNNLSGRFLNIEVLGKEFEE